MRCGPDVFFRYCVKKGKKYAEKMIAFLGAVCYTVNKSMVMPSVGTAENLFECSKKRRNHIC